MKYYLLEFSDEEFKVVSEDQLNEFKESAEEFDGFECWINHGEMILKPTDKELREALREQDYPFSTGDIQEFFIMLNFLLDKRNKKV